MATWRPLTPADVSSLMQIADTIHPGLPESAQVFTERINLYPEGCLALKLNDTDQLVGYAISHPIRHSQPPALDTLLGEIPSDADWYYIHDVAVLPELRGRGVAGECVRRLLGVATGTGLARTCLISVYDTEGFWGRFGFAREVVEEGMMAKLNGYGDGAVYLSRSNLQL
ncbi:acyl-CoA N-acyltransferase [Aspergillus karnatakaensis]|uniref:GNAT family N-acetyltransferase n=1 Tax=Aspergillus karnatakaensis TaxID=1810916 RepID=UPI003CCE1B31